MAMNPTGGAGNFSKFNNIKPGNPIQRKTTGPGPQQSPSVQQTPSESVHIGAQPVADAKIDSLSADVQKAEATPVFQSTPVTSSIPNQIGGALIAGINGTDSVSKPSFPGISLNGLGATSFETIGGKARHQNCNFFHAFVRQGFKRFIRIGL